MERRSRVSAVDEDLELAERSPSPPMLPPFRRPAAPPPPPPSTTAPRRSLGDSLPRRSLLAPEVARPSDEDYAHGRDSDERKSAEEPENEKPRDRRPRKKRRSRIISELRPVDGPGSALPSVPAINDDDSQVSDDPLEAPESGERAKEVFQLNVKEERSELQFAAESNGTFRAIEALFQIPQIAADSATSSVSRSQEKVDRTRLQPRSPTSLLAISSSSSSDLASNSSSSSGDSSQSSSTANASSNSDSSSQLASNSTSESASGSQLPETATVKVTMTEPLNGEVYSLSSTMLVEWHVTLLSGPDPGLDKFRVDFSADNGEFDTIAANISTPSSSQDANTTVYQYEWDLADNIRGCARLAY
ncbi:hypothetical protein GQ600_13302 [Phytophthora cactorum]|nr:hypothetical protein GQ600_13302 [Phytophthora cactorum]